MQQPEANVLIWVESDDELAREKSARRHRSLIVVAHGYGQGTMERSFVISYPVVSYDHVQHLPAVSGMLETMGWSVKEARRGQTDGGVVQTTVLVSTADFGREQRLWLAEPVGEAYDPRAPGHALVPGPSPALGGDYFRTRQIRDQIEAWVNEGGAGDDVAS